MYFYYSAFYCSVAQLCPTLCNMDCSMPGLPVSHHLQKFVQVHVSCFGDAIQASHPLMPSISFCPPKLEIPRMELCLLCELRQVVKSQFQVMYDDYSMQKTKTWQMVETQ